MPASHSTIALGEVLRQYRLGLVLVAGASARVLDRAVKWVHASELEDPTPFLPPHTVLLTTGARFSLLPLPEDAEAYVRRLIDAGTTALGFAVGLHWDRIPSRLVAACDEQGLPLFRVPYDTAFIEIVQTTARLIDAQQRARDLWAIESQRAVANASLHREGLDAAIREAATRLSRWVCITDDTGRVMIEAVPEAADGPLHEALAREVVHLVERGASASRVERSDGPGIRLQSLGRRGRSLGVLAVEDRGAPDTAERTLLELVSALATVQLEHRSSMSDADTTLRTAVMRLLLEGQRATAEQVSADTLGGIPRDPVAVVRLSESAETRISGLTTSFGRASPGVLGARHAGRPLLIVETKLLPDLNRELATVNAAAGISEPGSCDDLTPLLEQADRALEHAIQTESTNPVAYRPSLHDGVLHLLEDLPGAHQRAESLLSPVRAHDERYGDAVERSLAVWLAHHGQMSAAATELGVHRHTLRGRITTAAGLLQLDLDSPDARAELWTALRLSVR